MLSAETVLLLVLVVILGFIVLVGFGIFLYFFLRTVQELLQSLNRAVEILTPLTAGVGLADVVNNIVHASKIAIELGRSADKMSGLIEMLYKAIFLKEPATVGAAAAEAAEGSSGFFSTDERRIALQEQVRELRRRGIKVGEEEYPPEESERVTEKPSPETPSGVAGVF